MNIKELQNKQKELDEFIVSKMNLNLTDEHMLVDMMLAAIDELCNEVKEDIENAEEWIDELHFVLSIGNRLGVKIQETNMLGSGWNLQQLYKANENHLLSAMRLSKCFKHWSKKRPSATDMALITNHLGICVESIKLACIKLNTDMEQEYNKKYEINRERQLRGDY